jgi:serine/threonine-protein kinase HipA
MSDIAPRFLNVFVGSQLMGKLGDNDGYWAFEYDTQWLECPDRFAIYPDLPLKTEEQLDTGSKRPIQRFFDNLLPEENARLLLAAEVEVDHEDSFSLLAASGIESAGALTLLDVDQTFPAIEATPLSDVELNERIENLPRAPLNNREGSRMSLAGAQHKMLIVILDNQMHEGNAGTPSTHILKPEHSEPEKYWQTLRNEWFIMKLADRCGLNVPLVDIKYTPRPVYIIERFDRDGQYPNQTRKHIIDACQLLGYGRGSKYTASTPETYRKLLGKVRLKALAAMSLYQWVIFNLLIGNGDAHLKNISFFYKNGSVELTPFYDLLSTVIYVNDGARALHEKVSIPINSKERFDEINRDDVLAFANEIRVPKRAAQDILDRMLVEVAQQFPLLYQEAENAPANEYKAGELRMLKQIEHLVFRPMFEQLS